jgi:hypothetical protein
MSSENAQPPQVAAAIVAAMRAVGEVGKRGKNQEQGFKYRKYDDILSVAHDALVEAGLAILPDVVEMKQRTQEVTTKAQYTRTVTTTIVKVEYTFIAAADASERKFTFYGEASDYGDKSLGKALSYADKMMLIGVLKIPVTSDDIDPDQHSHADDEPVGRGERPRTQRPGQVREPKASTAAARRGAEQARAAIRKGADAPAPPPPPAESDDELHAQIIERLAVLSDDPEAEGGLATLEKIWGDIERTRLERNAWSLADHKALRAHVGEIGARIKAAEAARAAAAAEQLRAHRPDPGEVDPWSDDPREAAEARVAIDVAEGRTPAVFNGPSNQSRATEPALIDAPAPPRQGNPDARA